MIVVDAGVVANALGDHGAAGNLARARLRRAEGLAAPDLLDVETVSVVRKRTLDKTLTPAQGRAIIRDLLRLAVERYSTAALLERAYELRDNLTPYDAVYVALAERLGCSLVTADARMARAPTVRCEVELLHD